jgi:MOSC domain-containing protein YiiM
MKSDTARLVKVCTGTPRLINDGTKQVASAIFKTATELPVRVSELNLAGDEQADLSVHGGRDKAVYAYPETYYREWEKILGRTLEDSQFGENLTVSVISDADVIIGDRYRVGSSELIVTQPRLPCFKLGLRIGDPSFPNALLRSGRLGFYLRVDAEGELQQGDEFRLIGRPDHGISVHALWSAVFLTPPDIAVVRRALDLLPYLDDGWRRRLRKADRSGR